MLKQQQRVWSLVPVFCALGCGGGNQLAPADGQLAEMPLEDARLGDPDLVAVPSGAFMMGSRFDERGRDPDEGPIQALSMPAFLIDRSSVTVESFELRQEELAEADPGAEWTREGETPTDWPGRCNLGSLRRDHPANCVNWVAAHAFCRLRDMDLPTEAELEYAIRAGSTTAYWWGSSFETTHTVGSVSCGTRGCAGGTEAVVRDGDRCNAWGVCDAAGNVWQWTLTEYAPQLGSYVSNVPTERPASPVIRGGAWVNDDPRLFRSSHRGLAQFAGGLTEIGFRCVRR